MQEKNKNNYASPLLRRTGFFHGGYYLLTGLWSLVSISSFQAVTGSKTDIWLVKTIGLLLTVSGLVFLYSAARRSFPVETVILAIGTALALAFIEITYGGVFSRFMDHRCLETEGREDILTRSINYPFQN
jgi:hypothetical protein